MKKYVLVLMMLFVIGVVSAHTGHDEHGAIEQGEAIVNAEIPCESLTDEQLEMVGDYFMEQMHPGEAHEAMDEMMGGEGSESLRLVHINMAKNIYCGDNQGVGMMNSMMDGSYSGNLGMMGGYNTNSLQNNWLMNLVFVIVASVIFGLIFWGTRVLFVKDKKK